MKTFDYELAWQELALPAYQKLNGPIPPLLAATATASEALNQLPDCSMPWPDGDLRGRFEAVDSETLALAAMVIYHYGHWRPGKNIAGDAPRVPGTYWKFSHYADQTLRSRFNVGREVKNGVGLLIHEGTVRVAYSSRDMWTWHEVAPATEKGMEQAAKIADTLRRKIASNSSLSEKDNIAWRAFEEIKSTVAWPEWDASKYMVEESVIELRRAQRMPKPDKEELAREVKAEFDKKVSELAIERDGELWLIENDLPINNAIYYPHTGRWCFGWTKPYAGEARTELLAKLAKFPFPYDVK